MVSETLETFKRIAFGLFVVLVVAFFVVIFFVDIKKYITKSDESIILNGTYIRVLKNGQLKWEVWTKKIIISPGDEKYSLNDIYKGIYYRKDKPPFIFSAKKGSYNGEIKQLILEGDINLDSANGDYLHTQKIEWNGTPDILSVPTRLELSLDGNHFACSQLDANGANMEQVILRGEVKAVIPDIRKTASKQTKQEMASTDVNNKYFENIELDAERIEYDGTTKFMKCFPQKIQVPIFIPGEAVLGEPGKVSLNGKYFTIKSGEFSIDLTRKFARAVSRVWILKKKDVSPGKDLGKAQKTLRTRESILETDEAFYYWSAGYVDIPGVATITQKGLQISAGKAFLDNKRDSVFLSENVDMHQFEGDWLIKEGLVDKKAREKVTDASRQETFMKCKTMDVNFTNEDINAAGDVVMNQPKKKRKLYGSAASYTGDNKVWTVYGTPAVKDGDNRMTAGRFTYNTKSGEFDASEGVSAELKVEDNYRQDVDDYYRDREGAGLLPGIFERDRLLVVAPSLHYNEDKDLLTSGGRVKITYRDLSVSADSIRVDYSQKTSSGEGDVVVKDPYTEIKADQFFMDKEEKQIKLTSNVFVKDIGHPATEKRNKSDAFDLMSKSFDYNWKTKKGQAVGAVKIHLEGRTVSADKLDLDRGNKVYKFYGNVVFHQENGDWLKGRDLLDENDKPSKNLSRQRTHVTCDSAVIDDGNDTAFFDGGVTVAQPDKKLMADSVDVNKKDKIYTFTGKVTYHQENGDWLKGGDDYDEDDKVANNALGKPADVTCAKAVFNDAEKTARLEGGVAISQPDKFIRSDTLDADRSAKLYTFTGSVSFHQDNGDWLKGGDLYDEEDKQQKAVVEKPTDLTCDKAVFNDKNKTARFDGSVTMSQKDKQVRADYAEIDRTKKRLTAGSDIVFTQTDGGWLFEGGFIEDDDDKDVKEKAQKPFRVTAKTLESNYGEKKMLLSGGIVATQGTDKATSDKLWHFGKENKTILEGKVTFKDAKRSLKTRRMVYDSKNKTIEAFSSINASADVDKEKRRAK